MKTTIICRTTAKDTASFYIRSGNKQYFLFNQPFRRSVKQFFQNGVLLNRALDPSHAYGNRALIRTMRKLPAYIRYIEKEEGVLFFTQTKRKQEKLKRKPLAYAA